MLFVIQFNYNYSGIIVLLITAATEHLLVLILCSVLDTNIQ